MTTFIQAHLLTVYPPANLNRDDLGRPKSALFGGALRLRVSSQSLKRAWRTSTVFQDRLEDHLGKRTQRFGEEVEKHLKDKGAPADEAGAIAREIAGLFGKSKSTQDKNPTYTEQLAFISPEEQAAAFALAERALAGAPIDAKTAGVLHETDTAVDIAMFGRMLASSPEYSREAAVQVAHAITTHRAVIEDDYYTAVDDLKRPSEDAGASFVGEAGFGSGLFYLYVCVDRDLLIRNLGGNATLAADGIAALMEAAATVAPKGKQASFASRARAAYILVEKGQTAPRTLAGAFFRPIGGEDPLAGSVAALTTLRENFARAYGDDPDMRALNVATGVGTLGDLIDFARG